MVHFYHSYCLFPLAYQNLLFLLEKTAKRNKICKAILAFTASLLLFFAPELISYQSLAISSETMAAFSQINVDGLYQYVSKNAENFDEQTNCCDVEIEQADVLLYFNDADSFDEMKGNPFMNLSFREKLFSKHEVSDHAIVIAYPLIREPDIDTIPLNRYAYNKISVYNEGRGIDILYWTENKDPALLQKIAQELKAMSDTASEPVQTS